MYVTYHVNSVGIKEVIDFQECMEWKASNSVSCLTTLPLVKVTHVAWVKDDE
jgi:hypothetical protein